MQLLNLVGQIRELHPTIGLRDLYFKIKPETMGRDRFEAFCKEYDLRVSRVKNFSRTTDSSGIIRFENLKEKLVVNNINQLWQSDITYYDLNGKFYYLTFIIDAYSRRIVGHHTSMRLLTESTTLPALNMAIKLRNEEKLNGLIFHSDGGGQYYDTDFLRLTKSMGIRNSMCEYAWENGKAERINGVIKNNYLRHRSIKTFAQLVSEVDRAVRLYNADKPHIALQRKSPITFENELLSLQQQTLPKMTGSLNAKTRILGASSPFKSEQTLLENQESKTAININ